MLTLVALVGIAFHIYFVYYVWVNIGILWALAMFFIPFVVFVVAYRYWYEVKVPFLGYMACGLIIGFARG